jgi:hypothetical protein
VLDYRGRYDAFPGALVGMKPPEFAVWMFAQLGARAGDELADLFRGSGAIGRAWDLYTSPGPDVGRDASRAAAAGLGDASRGAVASRDASLSPAPATGDGFGADPGGFGEKRRDIAPSEPRRTKAPE